MGSEAQQTNNQAIESWNKWKSEHQKVYTNSDEENTRYTTWKKSYDWINANNQDRIFRGLPPAYGLNPYSDLTQEEFSKMVGKQGEESEEIYADMNKDELGPIKVKAENTLLKKTYQDNKNVDQSLYSTRDEDL